MNPVWYVSQDSWVSHSPNGRYIGPIGGGPGILDSNFKRIADSGFKFQNHRILDSNSDRAARSSRILDSDFLVHPVRGCNHPIGWGSYQISLERWKWFFPFPSSFHPISFKIYLLRKTDLHLLTNAMTEFTPVVVVVDFYWSNLITECPREGHLVNNDFKKHFA